MHANNPYTGRYNLIHLAKHHPDLKQHLIVNTAGEPTIDFSSSESVYALNKAMLLADFNLKNYVLPTGYLIPPIPGRLDYLLHLNDFLQTKEPNTKGLRGLDIGAGANAIYCILGAQHFNWEMLGCEADPAAVKIANANLAFTEHLKSKTQIKLQEDKRYLLKGIIQPGEYYDFSVCNPPFHTSKEEALKSTQNKLSNLKPYKRDTSTELNFQGQANELWCNGGEALFIKRLIKESTQFKKQVGVFSSLVSKSENLAKLKKQLEKAKANYHIIPMEHGNKKSRILCWWF